MRKCRHENTVGGMWRTTPKHLSFIGIEQQWVHAFKQPGDPSHHHRIICADCGEWLSLGPARDTADTAIEVRAAEIAIGLAEGGCHISMLEQCGFNDEFPRTRGGGVVMLETDSQQAGRLASIIASHGEQGGER